ncbi:MAG: hypothetical protein KGI98_17275 [Euryarchaeota archaeon]|nr:hypothetical protein [Euryarchaeota archaeon]
MLAAASGFREPPTISNPPQQSCGRQSTILLASSTDGGTTWSVDAFPTPGATVTNLQAAVQGNRMAVGWIEEPVGACSTTAPGNVSAVESTNAGGFWSVPQNLTPAGATLPANEELQMTQEQQGILLAFQEQLSSQNGSKIALWLFPPASGGFGSSPVLLNATESWILQGNSRAPAFLITPSYLIQLTGNSPSQILGLPFTELQSDAGVGRLPGLVSLVPLSGSVVEIAATMPSGVGVDCWVVDVEADDITPSCHVPLAALALPAAEVYPIVSLVEGGGYWVAIGAVGVPTCYYGCPNGASWGGGAVGSRDLPAQDAGTSVCNQGCASSSGLAAYVFEESSQVGAEAAGFLAVLTVGIGLAWLGVTRRARRRLEAARPPSGERGNASEAAASKEPQRVLNDYRRGLLVWLLAWAPLLILGLAPGTGAAGGFVWVSGLAMVGGILGGIGAMPFHAAVRRALQQSYQVRPERLFFEDPSTMGLAQERVRLAALAAYASWAAGFLVVSVFLLALEGSITRADVTSAYSPLANQLASGAYILLGAVLLVTLLRTVLHASLADSMALVRARMTLGSDEAPIPPSTILRGRIGAALLVWNPFVGLLVGWAMQPAFPSAPSMLPWAFLPVTLLGMAILWGLYGATSWSPEPVAELSAKGVA